MIVLVLQIIAVILIVMHALGVSHSTVKLPWLALAFWMAATLVSGSGIGLVR